MRVEPHKLRENNYLILCHISTGESTARADITWWIGGPGGLFSEASAGADGLGLARLLGRKGKQ